MWLMARTTVRGSQIKKKKKNKMMMTTEEKDVPNEMVAMDGWGR